MLIVISGEGTLPAKRWLLSSQESLIHHNVEEQHLEVQYAWTNNVFELKDNYGQAVAFQKSVEKKLLTRTTCCS